MKIKNASVHCSIKLTFFSLLGSCFYFDIRNIQNANIYMKKILTYTIPIISKWTEPACDDPGILSGGPGPTDRNKRLMLIFSPQLISQRGGVEQGWLLKKSIIFQMGDPSFSRGLGGSNCLFL